MSLINKCTLLTRLLSGKPISLCRSISCNNIAEADRVGLEFCCKNIFSLLLCIRLCIYLQARSLGHIFTTDERAVLSSLQLHWLCHCDHFQESYCERNDYGYIVATCKYIKEAQKGFSLHVCAQSTPRCMRQLNESK